MENQKNIRCNVCGGNDITFLPHTRIGKCNCCGALLTLPDFEDYEILSLLDQAYIQRTSCKFDEAIATYNFIIEKNPNEISAYEGLLLAKYGIVYEYDEIKQINVPTCRRYNPKDVLEDESYISYLSYCASEEEKDVFRERAKEISYLQKEITKQLKNEKDYDVFISFKAKDEEGKTSRDAEIARELYDKLSDKGLRVFMSEVTLKNKISQEYEPIIFRALHSANYFILVGTSKENIDSNWVRNEWSRYIDRIKDPTDDVTLDTFICVYDGMNPNLFPRVNHKTIQCVDASDLNYKFNVVDYICRQDNLRTEKEPLFKGSSSKRLLCSEKISSNRPMQNYITKYNPIKTQRKSRAFGFFSTFMFIVFFATALYIAAFEFTRAGTYAHECLVILGGCFYIISIPFFIVFLLTLKSSDYYLHISKDDLVHVSFGKFANKISIGNDLFYSGKSKVIEFEYCDKPYSIEIEKEQISLYSLGD